MSTCSPVTLRTTSGPVTNTRPSGAMITTSVSAGPYAAPPAAKPSDDGNLRDETGRADHGLEDQSDGVQCLDALGQTRATGVPEAHDGGRFGSMAVSIAVTMCLQPSTPIAPPMTVASEQYAMVRTPSMFPDAASTPDLSRACSGTVVPGSKRFLQARKRIARICR